MDIKKKFRQIVIESPSLEVFKGIHMAVANDLFDYSDLLPSSIFYSLVNFLPIFTNPFFFNELN